MRSNTEMCAEADYIHTNGNPFFETKTYKRPLYFRPHLCFFFFIISSSILAIHFTLITGNLFKPRTHNQWQQFNMENVKNDWIVVKFVNVVCFLQVQQNKLHYSAKRAITTKDFIKDLLLVK